MTGTEDVKKLDTCSVRNHQINKRGMSASNILSKGFSLQTGLYE